MKLIDVVDFTLNTKYPLLPEQQEGVRFLLERTRAILAFQTGLGKTYTVTTAFNHVLNNYPDRARGIVICPVNALKAFKRELSGKLGFKNSEIGWITKQEVSYDLNKNRVIVFTYTALEEYAHLIRKWKENYITVAMIDEAHKLQAKDTKTKQLLVDLKPYFDILWLSTATPLMNDIEGLFNLVDYLEPRFFGTKTNFYNQYVNFVLKDIWVKGGGKRKVRDVKGYKNLDDLKNRLDKIAIMRQLKYDLEFIYSVGSLTDEEESLYERASKGILSDEERGHGARMHDLQRVVDNAFSNEVVSPSPYDSSKEILLIDNLKAIIKQDYGVIVYADYHDTVDRISNIINRYQNEIGYNNLYLIDGSVNKKQRGYIEDNLSSKDILIITSAGSESLNLQGVNCILFYDIPFSVGKILQVIGRVTRMDTAYSKLYVYVTYMKNTIDEYKYLLFLDNANLIKQLIGSDANMPIDLKELDRSNLEILKNKYLWHYKDDTKKRTQKIKKQVKERLLCCNVATIGEEIYSMSIDLNPVAYAVVSGAKRSNYLTPADDVYNILISDSTMMPVFKNKYIDQLRSSDTKAFLNELVNAIVVKNKTIVLVDNFGVGEIVKKFILDNL